MEQRDYLLREIEKIGAVISAFRQRIFGGNENLAITLEKQIENSKEMLLTEMNFDLDKFFDLDTEGLNEYISDFEGFSIENIELLAECFSEIGFSDKCNNSKKYLLKALELYDLCNFKSRIYSIERETNIMSIKNKLYT